MEEELSATMRERTAKESAAAKGQEKVEQARKALADMRAFAEEKLHEVEKATDLARDYTTQNLSPVPDMPLKVGLTDPTLPPGAAQRSSASRARMLSVPPPYPSPLPRHRWARARTRSRRRSCS